MIEGVGGWIANRLPWIGTMRMHQSLGDVLTFAADGVEAGSPVHDSLADAAQITANSALRTKVYHWVDEMTGGESVADAARRAGMPPLVCGMLSTGLQTADTAAALRFLGRYYSSRFSRSLAMLEALMLPMMAILMGGLVLWFLLSVMIPLARLIDATSPYPVRL
jgi:type II secretory pathway component PulF